MALLDCLSVHIFYFRFQMRIFFIDINLSFTSLPHRIQHHNEYHGRKLLGSLDDVQTCCKLFLLSPTFFNKFSFFLTKKGHSGHFV